MAQQHPYSAYKVTNVQTADQRTLIVMLYDGAIRFLKKAEQKIEAGDMEAAHNYLVRSRDIVAELLATLKPEKAGEVGMNLKRLYVFVFDTIVEANLMKDTSKVAAAVRILATLREGWSNMKVQQAPMEGGLDRKRINLNS